MIGAPLALASSRTPTAVVVPSMEVGNAANSEAVPWQSWLRAAFPVAMSSEF